jgi:hypothetical protein
LFLEFLNISDATAVAGYLANLFPNVFSLEVIFACEGESYFNTHQIASG